MYNVIASPAYIIDCVFKLLLVVTALCALPWMMTCCLLVWVIVCVKTYNTLTVTQVQLPAVMSQLGAALQQTLASKVQKVQIATQSCGKTEKLNLPFHFVGGLRGRYEHILCVCVRLGAQQAALCLTSFWSWLTFMFNMMTFIIPQPLLQSHHRVDMWGFK